MKKLLLIFSIIGLLVLTSCDDNKYYFDSDGDNAPTSETSKTSTETTEEGNYDAPLPSLDDDTWHGSIF